MSEQITDVKEAALRILLKRLGDIDHDASTRASFGGSIVMGQMYQMDKPVFEQELILIRGALGIPEPDNAGVQITTPSDPKPKEFSLDEL